MFQKPTTLAEFFAWLQPALAADSFVQCSLGKPPKAPARSNDATKNRLNDSGTVKRALLRPVHTKTGASILLVTTEARRDLTRTMSASEALTYVEEQLGTSFLSATVKTTERDLFLEIAKSGTVQIGTTKASIVEAPSREHNREKSFALSATIPWLRDLGIANAAGEIRSEMRDKFIQIERFLNILRPVIRDIPAQQRKISVIDVGSGKSYLTFALHHILRSSFPEARLSVIGVEKRNDLTRLSNDVALAHELDGLRFVHGLAEDALSAALDIVVALHACDTATDDAIALALRAQARVVCVAPCCHKYVRKKMRPHGPLALLVEHGIHAERLGETVTDALRALFLESRGYDAKVVEFIDKSHTAKNTMIIGVARRDTRTKELETRGLRHLEELRNAAGLPDFYLDALNVTAAV